MKKEGKDNGNNKNTLIRAVNNVSNAASIVAKQTAEGTVKAASSVAANITKGTASIATTISDGTIRRDNHASKTSLDSNNAKRSVVISNVSSVLKEERSDSTVVKPMVSSGDDIHSNTNDYQLNERFNSNDKKNAVSDSKHLIIELLTSDTILFVIITLSVAVYPTWLHSNEIIIGNVIPIHVFCCWMFVAFAIGLSVTTIASKIDQT